MSDDLSEFHDVFFEEAEELIENMESELLEMLSDSEDPERINTIFRAAHSIKGGSATFGFMAIAEVTHVMETLMDEVREGNRQPHPPLIDLLLKATDSVRNLLECAKQGEEPDASATAAIKAELEAELAAGTSEEQQAPLSEQEEPDAAPPQVQASVEDAPLPESSETPSTAAVEEPPVKQSAENKIVEPEPKKTTAKASGSSSIRVGIDKIDLLINLVGELVITQSMLNEEGGKLPIDMAENLQEGLSQLQRYTRELQENVMQIRMVPISTVFNRLPRMVHDLTRKLGKQVALQVHGEQTELDKTVLESMGDPLVHLVRNAIDHGIEMPEKRRESGKPEEGVVQLNAYHESGNIIIKIEDDGKGIDPDVIYAKAVEKGVIADGADLSKQEIYELLFHPGFSTAEQVSDVSGRGVGMDVVRRNIQDLGGNVEIDSELGAGSTFTIRLPLTLAIMDGQLVRVGNQTYVLPLTSIVESVQLDQSCISIVAGKVGVRRPL